VHYVSSDKINAYSHSHLTNFESQNSHSTNENFYQLRHITNLHDDDDVYSSKLKVMVHCSDKFEVTPQSVPYLAGTVQLYVALCLV